jgi:hypothetical protein
MNEKQIRARIEQFLQATARTVVVPASLGLGLAASGCESHSLHTRAADAGRDIASQISDAAVLTSDTASTAPDAKDAPLAPDLPLMAVPYLVVAFPPDAAPPDRPADIIESEAGVRRLDAGPDIPDAYVPIPPLIYIVFISPTESKAMDRSAPSDPGEAAVAPSQEKA